MSDIDLKTWAMGSNWQDSSAYLNHPGLIYLWYVKLRQLYNAANNDSLLGEVRQRLDDEDWTIFYNGVKNTPDYGNIQLQFNVGNTVLAEISDHYGNIDSSGNIHVYFYDEKTKVDNGYIDPETGYLKVNYV